MPADEEHPLFFCSGFSFELDSVVMQTYTDNEQIKAAYALVII